MVEQDSRGKDVDLSVYKGKVLLVVNVASKWFVSCQSPVSNLDHGFSFKILVCSRGIDFVFVVC